MNDIAGLAVKESGENRVTPANLDSYFDWMGGRKARWMPNGASQGEIVVGYKIAWSQLPGHQPCCLCLKILSRHGPFGT